MKKLYVLVPLLLCACSPQDNSHNQNKTSPAAGSAITAAPANAGTAPLPGTHLVAWNADGPGVVVTSSGNVVQVAGNDSRFGYQVSTPQLEVKPNSDVVVNLRLHVEAGHVCVGVLDQARNSWVRSPDDAAAEIKFNTGSNAFVHVVLANCNASESGNQKSRFSIEDASLSPGQKG